MNKHILVIFLLIGLSACTNLKHTNHIDLYRELHPLEAKEYRELHSISIEAAEKFDNYRKHDTKIMLDRIEAIKNHPELLLSYINLWRNSNEYSLSRADWWVDIKSKLKTGDTLCEYIRDSDGEAGYIVLREGNIVFRRVTAGNPGNRNIDNR